MRVLVVDDSVVFRSQIKAALDDIEGIQVVGSAANGKIALDRIEQGSVDVVILDLEMPGMSGLEMLELMQKRKMNQTVIVFAAPVGSGVELAMLALRAGAADFIAKPQASGSLEQALEGIQRELVPKILQFKGRIDRVQAKNSSSIDVIQQKAAPAQTDTTRSLSSLSMLTFKPRVIGIGSSTGGPTALDSIFAKLKGATLHVPILIAQHMPPNFTQYLAKRLGEISGHPAKEAAHGDILKPGCIYVAPGDFHMTVQRNSDKNQVVVCLDQSPKRNSVRPAVDNLFESLAKIYGSTSAAIVLTGMGEDGTIGAKAIKAASGAIMIQDQNSSVVWGMPGSIHAAGAYDAIGNLDECAQILLQMAG